MCGNEISQPAFKAPVSGTEEQILTISFMLRSYELHKTSVEITALHSQWMVLFNGNKNFLSCS